MLRIARILNDVGDLAIGQELKIEGERTTKGNVGRALATWVAEWGQPNERYLAVDLIAGPMSMTIQEVRLVTDSDGNEITRDVQPMEQG